MATFNFSPAPPSPAFGGFAGYPAIVASREWSLQRRLRRPALVAWRAARAAGKAAAARGSR